MCLLTYHKYAVCDYTKIVETFYLGQIEHRIITIHYTYIYYFRVAVKITNKGRQNYTVKVILRVESVDYTGKNGSLIAKVEDEKIVGYGPGKRDELNEYIILSIIRMNVVSICFLNTTRSVA